MFNFINLLYLGILLVKKGVLLRLIAYILIKYISKNYEYIKSAEKKLSRAAVSFLESAGPTFIKLGQTLSTRPDLTGEVFSEELSFLQDKLPPFDSEIVFRTIESELSCKVNTLFKFISKKPIAAGSIAQVHYAEMKDGNRVAVKVLRPGIEKQFQRDLNFLYFLVRFLQKAYPKTIRLRLNEAINTLSKIVKFELDLRFEAAAADKMRENCKEDADTFIPKVFWELTGKKVLTIEWVDGVPVNDKKALIAAGHDLHEVAKKLAISFFNQAYRDGFFHADLHPGNILINKQGQIALIDFGIIGSLKEKDRLSIAEIIYGFILRDYKRVADVHFKVGWIPRDQDPELFALACRSIGEPIIGLPVNRISFGKLLKQLLEVTSHFKMEPQLQLLLLQKTMMNIEGVGFKIYPAVNMWKLAEPWMKKWAEKNFGLRAKLNHVKDDFLNILSDLPHEARNLSSLVKKYNNMEFQKNESINNEKQKYNKLKYFIAGVLATVLVYLLNLSI